MISPKYVYNITKKKKINIYFEDLYNVYFNSIINLLIILYSINLY